MKRGVIFSIVVFGLIFFVGGVGVATAADKFAYVDLSRIFSEYSKTKEYDKVLGDKEQTATAEIDKKAAEIKEMADKTNLLSDKEKETKRPELEAKYKAFSDFKQQKEMDLRKEQNEKMKEILKDIEETVKQYAQKEGYSLVFNNRVLVYETKSMDITDKIIEILNKGYKK